MRKGTLEALESPELVLDEIVRLGASRMLQAAVGWEVEDFVLRHSDLRDEQGRARVIRNGYLPKRSILTGAGRVAIEQPRVRDRQKEIRFHSSILPPYLRRSGKIEELIPWLYLRGISSGNMQEALEALLGSQAPGLSANVVVKLKEVWVKEWEQWRRRDLSEKRFVYWWVDGIYCNVRLEEERQCILVVMGATAQGEKELLAIQDGYRESEQAWKELLLDLKARGLKTGPSIAVGDGALGFWAAFRKLFPKSKEQRCWVHKTANVLNKLPKSAQARAKDGLHQIWMAQRRAEAEEAFDRFVAKYEAKYPKAVGCLKKDRQALLAFYDFPAEHWRHLRTTNPIESTFATVRLRHRRTKGNGTRKACLTMVFKLVQMAQKRWRRLNRPSRMAQVLEGRKFVDGVLQDAA